MREMRPRIMSSLRTPGDYLRVGAVVFLIIFAGCGPERSSSPYSPEDALQTFRLPQGFRIEMVASEPLISDPVEIAFDGNGLLYVAEMDDYPADAAPGGRIMLLEDQDGDGYFETGNVFADNLPYVNGVMPWRDGVLVTSAPDIIYLADTTGDRRADIRRVVVSGFAFTNPQLRVSSLRYGLDNWIYGAYSRAGGQRGYPEFTNHGRPLTFAANPRADSTDIYPGTDFRMRPDEFEIEPSGGMSQFGLAFDASGNRFTVWNNIHLRHVVIDARYAARNLYLTTPSLMASVSDHGNAAPVFSRAQDRLDLHESEIGHFTSACGHSLYTGGLFKGTYAGAAFVCEPVSNVVHADLLSKSGATFSARRDREGEEFLSSTDSWFRPVNTTVGPDGGLYIVDFYRKLVEHPAWIAHADDKGIYTHAGVLQEADFLEGNDRGRIYRIVPEDFNRKNSPTPGLRTATTQELVAALAHPNLWWRTTAQRLLVERQDTSAIPPLRKLAAESSSPEGRIHALHTLEGLQSLDNDMIITALADESPLVRKQAVLLGEAKSSVKGIRDAIVALADDQDQSVQFQVALTLTTMPSAISFEPLSRIAGRHIRDPWFRQAVLFNAHENPLQWFAAARAFENSDAESGEGKIQLIRMIASVVGASGEQQYLSHLLSLIRKEKDAIIQQATLLGLASGIRPGARAIDLSAQGQHDLIELIRVPSTEVRQAALTLAEKINLAPSKWLRVAVQEARKNALDVNATAEVRTHAIRILGLDPENMHLEIFDQMLSPKPGGPMQVTAAAVLARRDDPRAMGLLLNHWQSYTAEVRGIVESSFTGSSRRLSFLMNALDEGVVDPSWLSRTTRSRLAEHPDREIRQRAEKFFGDLLRDNRDEVVTAFYEATTLKGNAARGKEIFRAACSTCHRLENVGRAFGPDLLSVRNQTRINLLTMILHPNNNIAAGYDGYLIETTEAQTFAGILINENSGGVAVRTADGNERVIARENIKTILPMSQSLMPEGLEGEYSKQDMADLLEYVKGGF